MKTIIISGKISTDEQWIPCEQDRI